MSVFLIILALAAAAIYVAAMQQDLLHRRIPNSFSIAIAAIALVRWLALRDLSSALWALGVAAMLFGVTFLLFARGWMGGGDVKLMTASSFLLGPWETYPFLVYTALAGGVVTLVVLAKHWASRWFRPAEVAGIEGGVARVSDNTVPYGVAIAIGALWVMVQQLLLNQQSMPR